MHDTQLSKVSQSRDQLLEKLASFLLSQFVLRGNEAKEFTIAAILHDQKQLVWRLNSFVQLYNVRMPNYFQNMDLPTDSLNIIHIRNFALVEDFYRHLKR